MPHSGDSSSSCSRANPGLLPWQQAGLYHCRSREWEACIDHFREDKAELGGTEKKPLGQMLPRQEVQDDKPGTGSHSSRPRD